MSWRVTQAEARARHLARCDEAEAGRYDALVCRPGDGDESAYLADLVRVVNLERGMAVLDAGAGTGALTSVLARIPGLAITALDPAPAFLARLSARQGLEAVSAVEGFCDALGDRALFPAARFDAIVSRQLANGLYDPIAAFANWHHWLRPGGRAVVIDGLYGRDAWTGTWSDEVDTLPLACCQGTAALPYLIEAAGLRVESVTWMDAVNALPATRTRRYVVVASRPG